MRIRLVLITAPVALLAASLALTACSDDDGGGVRDVGDGATGSGSASGSASGPASGSGSGSGSAATTCEPVGDLETAATTVDVGLDEWAIDVEEASVPAGRVGFVAENRGELPHELVIVRGVAPADLPLDDAGALDEPALPDGALVGEIEVFPAGETCDGTFELTAGEYTLVCNVLDAESGQVHLAEGMVATLTVT